MTLFRFRFACLLPVVALLGLMAPPAIADTLQDIAKLLKQGQQAQALEQVDKYLAGKPRDPQGRFLRGLILTEMNRPTEAIAVFQKLTEDYPELPEPYNNLAVVYAQQKQYEKAKLALEMAIRTHPSYATAHENLGDIYARLASQAYDKALQLDSSNTSAQTKLSMIRDMVGSGSRPSRSTAVAPTVTTVADVKPAEPKAADAKIADVKPIEPIKPVEVKPAEIKSPMAKTGDVSALAAKAVESWAAAWSRKDIKDYLARYAKDFKTPGGISRSSWEAERTQRLAKPGTIVVSLERLRVTPDGADRATVHFRQHYRSANLKTASNKVLTLVHQDGKWLIQQESVGN
jgi:tetratricopeptide (TPR) repeat protein